MKRLEQDLKDLMNQLEHQAKEYEIDGTAIDMNEAISLGKNRAYSYSANRLRSLLKWHGIIPGGMPVKS